MLIAMGVLIILSILSVILLSKAIGGEIDEKKKVWEKNEKLVGQQIVLQNDTLLILNYNKISNKFHINSKDHTLGHNMEMSSELVKTLLIKE